MTKKSTAGDKKVKDKNISSNITSYKKSNFKNRNYNDDFLNGFYE